MGLLQRGRSPEPNPVDLGAMWCLIIPVFAAPAAPTMQPDELVGYVTPDGWHGRLRHYAGDGPPVVLVHNMGVNHLNWDFDPSISLAHALVEDRWDVWIPELPGDAGTTPPSKLARDFDFTQLSKVHLPAIVDRVLQVTDTDGVYLVGHSLGGILLYAGLDDLPILAGVSLAGTAQFEHPPPLTQMASGIYRKLNTRELTRRMVWTLPFNPFVGIFANPKNLDTKQARGLLKHAVDDSPRGVSAEIVHWMRRRRPLIDQRNGTRMIDYEAPVPLLALNGDRDRLVPLADAEHACARFANCRFEAVDGYGHLDLVLGKHARIDVYPQVLAFLNEHRRTAPAVVVSADEPRGTP